MPRFSVSPLIVNAIWFEVSWFCAVVLQDLLILAAFLIAHFIWISKVPKQELMAVIGCSMVGVLVDQSLALSGVFVFETPLIPSWLIMLWLCLSCTFGHSLRFFAARPLLSASLGAIGGTTSYLAGVKLGVVELGVSMFNAGVILAVIWLFLFPSLMILHQKLMGDYYEKAR